MNCATCQDFSYKFMVCFCPFNANTGGSYMTTSPSNSCTLYRDGKNDAPDTERKKYEKGSK